MGEVSSSFSLTVIIVAFVIDIISTKYLLLMQLSFVVSTCPVSTTKFDVIQEILQF